ncbi:MAG: hybrid sensor histidine kinase/response regulator [Rhodobacteraceae bacterium]|nr:hybrid sensor histidine kinase/response regulator [Paracoccaceae bacterium]SFD23999.1 PAS domain S-box-containing protein [Salipiger profundus]
MTFVAPSRRERALPPWRQGRVLLGVAAAAIVAAVIVLVAEVVDEFRSLNSASSDNVHWFLSQAEVEFLEFRNAIEVARAEEGDALDDALERLVVEYDVFYSRMMTLARGSLYSDIRVHEEFGQPVSDIWDGLIAMVPLIDGPRDALAANLDVLADEATEMRPLLREMATTGLQFFAENSDDSRDSVSRTLLWLFLLAVALKLTLLVVLVHTRRVSNQIERRGIELADAYARLNTILETSLDAVVVTDLDGRILTFNTAAERTFGYDQAEVLDRPIGDIIVPESYREAHRAGMKRMRDTGERKILGQGRIRLEAQRRSGEVFPVELALEHAQTGEEEIIVAFLRDISHRVAAETELVQARDRALAGEKAKAEFLAMMTHEIRTPLNGILGNLSLLEKTKLGYDQSRYIHNMGISGEVLMHHVDSVLDVARFESGAMVSRSDVVHMGRVLQDIVDSQASAAEANGNDIGWEWIGEPVDWVRVDFSRLRQVLLNLVSNAIKFTSDGRIRLEAEQNGKRTGCEVEIRVIDTGVGISEADQARVFDDFHMVDVPRSGSQSGTGLGLGIARRFVEAMGGEIGVESEPGEGSVFWLRLPLECVDTPIEETPSGYDMTDQNGRDILLVEDNEINLELAREMLTRQGHVVTEARNGQEAISAALTHRFDLILMDIRMPVLGGLEATTAIREGSGPNRDVPIVALSANVLPEARDRFLEAGMSDFLPKPLTQDALGKVIARYCNKPSAVEPPKDPEAADIGLDRLSERHRAEAQALFDWLATMPEDLTEIAERAHKVAGSAAAFGQSEVREALIALELVAEGSGDRVALVEAIAEARAAWQSAPEPSLV